MILDMMVLWLVLCMWTVVPLELKKVQENLSNLENMKTQLESRVYALSGAIQQCDIFLDFFDVNPTSSIPSQDNSAVSTALSWRFITFN